jgi:glutaredoxin 3
MSNFVIFSKDNCPYCVKAMNLLKIKNQEISEIKIGRDITREEFINSYPDQKTVPFIFYNDQKIGGYEQLEKWVKENL